VKILAVIIAVVLGLLGLLFLVAAGQGNAIPRVAIGALCLLAAVALVAMTWLKKSTVTHVQKLELDLSGDVKLENLTCRQCSAQLSSDAITYKAGTVFVHCPFCGANYQIEEAPKW
jgi:Zn finger protein HypA/HybF involved in hydrogenase expression